MPLPDFLDPQTHLALRMERVKLLIQRYMRTFSARLVRASGEYSDMCVGPEELQRILTPNHPTPNGTTGLNKLGIPSLPEINTALQENEDRLHKAFSNTNENTHLPMEEIRAGFMLDDMEMDLLIAAIAPLLSVDMMHLYTVAWADFTQRRPTAGFLADLVGANSAQRKRALDLLHDDHRLVRYRLLVPVPDPRWSLHTPRAHAPVEVPGRLLDFVSRRTAANTPLKGCTLHPWQNAPPLDGLVLPETTRQTFHESVRRPSPHINLIGPEGSGRRTLTRAFAATRNIPVLEVDLIKALLPGESGGVPTRLQEILREARLQNAVLLIRLKNLEDSAHQDLLRHHTEELQTLLESYPEMIVVTSAPGDERWTTLVGTFMDISMPALSTNEQEQVWKSALQEAPLSAETTRDLSSHLAWSHRLPPGSIFRVVETARRTASAPAQFQNCLTRSIRRSFDHNLGWLADTLSVEMSLEDVVLTHETRTTLRKVLAFARQAEKVFETWEFQSRSHGGNGLAVLFAGPPGTGKTLTAAVLARELGRVLYRVDLSRIVDKYIGETEKNLRRVFDEAERAHAVLLFDEADSLFGKRTQVKSSNDRYANLEVNYLLQRLESYDGMSILTTNLATGLDEAFQRRIRFKIDFEVPAPPERARLWRSLIPPKAPLSPDINWTKLGESFEFSGGHIRNAILRAAIEAANQGTSITYAQLDEAGIAESRDMGTLVRH